MCPAYNWTIDDGSGNNVKCNQPTNSCYNEVSVAESVTTGSFDA